MILFELKKQIFEKALTQLEKALNEPENEFIRDAPTMSDKKISRLWNAQDDLPIIYSMDIVHLQSLKNQPLLDAIHRDGCILWDITEENHV